MNKKVPLRQCVGCGEMKEKKNMIRIVRTTEETYVLDRTGKMNGRGAYICRSTDCLSKARKARRLEKSFSCKIEESVYEVMMNELGSEEENI